MPYLHTDEAGHVLYPVRCSEALGYGLGMAFLDLDGIGNYKHSKDLLHARVSYPYPFCKAAAAGRQP
ncbi:hypothetical protein D3C86_1987530 [compost metagenome]